MSDPFAGVVGTRRPWRQLRAELAGGRLDARVPVHRRGWARQVDCGRAARRRLAAGGASAPKPRLLGKTTASSASINEIRLLPDKPPSSRAVPAGVPELKPAIGARRVAVVANVGRLRDQGPGRLLKTLEEPHSHRVDHASRPQAQSVCGCCEVVSALPARLFPTRCRQRTSRLLTRNGVEHEAAHLLAELARGRPGWAMRVPATRASSSCTATGRGVPGVLAPRPTCRSTVAEELEQRQMAWRRSEGEVEDPRCLRGQRAGGAAAPHALDPGQGAGSLGPAGGALV